MEEYEFTIKVKISGHPTEQEVRDYIAFECGAHGSISMENPLMVDDEDEVGIIRIDIE